MLVQTAVGRAVSVAEALGELDGVVRAESVTGPYDVVVRVEVPTVDQLGPLIAVQMAAVVGITRTVTCTVMPR